MTSTERVRAHRARKRARKLAENPALADQRMLTILASGVLSANGGAVEQVSAGPAVEVPELPEDEVERAVFVGAEVQRTFLAVMCDPKAPAAARVAAGRSMAEMHGLLATRRTAPDPDELRRRSMEPADSATLERHVQELRDGIAMLDSIAASVRAGMVAGREAMPWD